MYSVWVPLATLVLIGMLSVGWRRYFSAYVKQKRKENFAERQGISHGIRKAYPVKLLSHICIMCSILLANSDEKVAGALKYIRPTSHLDHILEKNNG